MNKCQWCNGTGVVPGGFVCHCQRRIDFQTLKQQMFSLMQHSRMVRCWVAVREFFTGWVK